jgi:hypothetical protein
MALHSFAAVADQAVITAHFTGDTTGAPLSAGNPVEQYVGGCQGYTTCINGCRSVFYKVKGRPSLYTDVGATTCGAASFQQRLYVWEAGGASAGCSTFTCVGT